jgi:Zn-dependent protease with chaperone function
MSEKPQKPPLAVFLKEGVIAAGKALKEAMPRKPQEQMEWGGLALFVFTWWWNFCIAGVCRYYLGYYGWFVVQHLLSPIVSAVPLSLAFWNPLTYVNAFIATSPHTIGLALVVALGSWPLIGFIFPGSGRSWQRREGGRDPISSEKGALARAVAGLGIRDKLTFFVIDDDRAFSASLGRAIGVSRGLIESDALRPVITHEYGHVSSWDARISEGLRRMRCWYDPLAPRKDSDGKVLSGESRLPLEAMRWALRGGGGWPVLWPLKPVWSAYWRAREYGADRKAVSLGQGVPLATRLRDEDLYLDEPQPGLLLTNFAHPPVAKRIDRIEAACGGKMITWKTSLCGDPRWGMRLLVRLLEHVPLIDLSDPATP